MSEAKRKFLYSTSPSNSPKPQSGPRFSVESSPDVFEPLIASSSQSSVDRDPYEYRSTTQSSDSDNQKENIMRKTPKKSTPKKLTPKKREGKLTKILIV